MTLALAAGPVARQSATSGVVTLSGEAIIDLDSGARLYRAELRINAGGTVDQQVDSTISQIDAITDWVIPNGVAPGLFEFRFVNLTGVPDGDTNMVEDIWEPVGAGLIIGRQELLVAAQSESVTFDLEVRDGAGPLIDTAFYSLNIERIV